MYEVIEVRRLDEAQGFPAPIRAIFSLMARTSAEQKCLVVAVTSAAVACRVSRDKGERQCEAFFNQLVDNDEFVAERRKLLRSRIGGRDDPKARPLDMTHERSFHRHLNVVMCAIGIEVRPSFEFLIKHEKGDEVKEHEALILTSPHVSPTWPSCRWKLKRTRISSWTSWLFSPSSFQMISYWWTGSNRLLR